MSDEVKAVSIIASVVGIIVMTVAICTTVYELHNINLQTEISKVAMENGYSQQFINGSLIWVKAPQ